MKLKKAFTLAEAILTMTILGIIAATMVTTLKPGQYKQQGFDTLRKKTYAELDGVMQTFIVECCKDMNATTVYPYSSTLKTCDRNAAAVTFGNKSSDKGLDVATLFAGYMRGTLGTGGGQIPASGTAYCKAVANHTPIKLRNGVCIYFGNQSIKIDVNGNQKPEEAGADQMILTVGADGINQDVDTALTSTTGSF